MPDSYAAQPHIELNSGRWGSVAPALRFHNFRLLWISQIVSTTGTFLQLMAESWLVYDLTHSTLTLGIVGILGLAPIVPISLVGGLLIDRFPRRRLITACQVGLMLQAIVLGLLVASGQIRVWHIILLDFVLGALAAIDQPARQAFLTELVGRDALGNAIALNGTAFNVARAMGFVFSGALIAAIGPGGTCLLNALTFLAPLAALRLMRVRDVTPDTKPPSNHAWAEGIRTLRNQPVLVGALSLMVLVIGLTWPIYGMMPAFARDYLGTDSVGLGMLMSAAGVGAVVGSALIARLGLRRRGMLLLLVSVLVPILAAGFALSQTLVVAFVLSVALGLGMLVFQTTVTALVQTSVPNRVRGRVMALFSLLNAGAPRTAAVFVGALAQSFALPAVLTLGAGAALVLALGLHVMMPSIRRLD